MFGNIYSGKKVLVTGNTGFKGTWLSCWLRELGAEVYGYSVDIPSIPSNYEVMGLDGKINTTFNDVRNLAGIKMCIEECQPDIIFHLAAQPLVRLAYNEPLETIETNVMGVANVLDACRTFDCVKAIIIVTSDKCYENVEWNYGYRENDMLGGEDPYSASKGAAEIVASSYMRSYYKYSGTFVGTVRAGNVIGGGDWAKDRLVPDAMKAWSKNAKLTIRNPLSTRPWQHVLEPLSGYLHLGSELLKQNIECQIESFNFGPGSDVKATVEEVLVEMSKSWANVSWNTEIKGEQLKEAGLLKLSCDKALHILNWSPTLSFDETISFTVDWYREFYENEEFAPESFTRSQIMDYCQKAKDRGASWI